MVYDNSGSFSHQPLRRPVRHRTPSTAEADALCIVQVAAENPRFTPDEVYAEIRKGRSDISRDMVRAVLLG